MIALPISKNCLEKIILLLSVGGDPVQLSHVIARETTVVIYLGLKFQVIQFANPGFYSM